MLKYDRNYSSTYGLDKYWLKLKSFFICGIKLPIQKFKNFACSVSFSKVSKSVFDAFDIDDIVLTSGIDTIL